MAAAFLIVRHKQYVTYVTLLCKFLFVVNKCFFFFREVIVGVWFVFSSGNDRHSGRSFDNMRHDCRHRSHEPTTVQADLKLNVLLTLYDLWLMSHRSNPVKA
jgi:hypothetical protein